MKTRSILKILFCTILSLGTVPTFAATQLTTYIPAPQAYFKNITLTAQSEATACTGAIDGTVFLSTESGGLKQCSSGSAIEASAMWKEDTTAPDTIYLTNAATVDRVVVPRLAVGDSYPLYGDDYRISALGAILAYETFRDFTAGDYDTILSNIDATKATVFLDPIRDNYIFGIDLFRSFSGKGNFITGISSAPTGNYNLFLNALSSTATGDYNTIISSNETTLTGAANRSVGNIGAVAVNGLFNVVENSYNLTVNGNYNKVEAYNQTMTLGALTITADNSFNSYYSRYGFAGAAPAAGSDLTVEIHGNTKIDGYIVSNGDRYPIVSTAPYVQLLGGEVTAAGVCTCSPNVGVTRIGVGRYQIKTSGSHPSSPGTHAIVQAIAYNGKSAKVATRGDAGGYAYVEINIFDDATRALADWAFDFLIWGQNP